MDSDSDTTAVFEMRKGFHRFLNDDSSRKRSRLDLSTESGLLDTSTASTSFRDPESLHLKTELIYCKTRIGTIESQLRKKENEMKELIILHEKEIADVRRQCDRDLRSYEVLKTSHERVLHRQEDCEAELEDTKSNLTQVKQIFEAKVTELQRKNMEQEISYSEALDEQKVKNRELRNKLLSQQADLSVATIEVAQLKEQLAEAQRKLSGSQNNSVTEDDYRTRAQKAETDLAQLQKEIEQYKDDMAVLAARKQDLAKLNTYKEEMKKMTSQLNYYQATTENIEVMKEKVQTMERQLERSHDLQKKFAELEVENEALKQKLVDLQSNQVSADTVVRLKEAQAKEAIMLENLGALKSENRSLEARIKELEKSGGQLRVKLSGASDESQLKARENERLQRKISLLTKERDGYKKIIESYECDVTREVVPLSSDRNSQLQQALNSYRQANEQLERELRHRDNEILSLKREIHELEVRSANDVSTAFLDTSASEKVDSAVLLELREKVSELERQCEALTEEKAVLEARIEQRHLQGDYDPTKTKVVHFTMNPTAVAQKTKAEELKKLSDDNRKLRERVKVLESRLAEAHDLTAQVEANLKAPSALESQQLKDAKAKLASTETKMDKMVDMFKKTSLEFRQVVYQLLGYRIDVPKSKEYKLMSMYAATPDDYLLFQDCDGELQLLETDYASTLTELAEEHLHQHDSLPVFLSALTLELFKQQTMSISAI